MTIAIIIKVLAINLKGTCEMSYQLHFLSVMHCCGNELWKLFRMHEINTVESNELGKYNLNIILRYILESFKCYKIYQVMRQYTWIKYGSAGMNLRFYVWSYFIFFYLH